MREHAAQLSVLDLVPLSQGMTREDALQSMLELARCADDAGYTRYWLSEHHGSTTFLSSATTVLMGSVLAATRRIGVASGGIMLPNHAPLVVAEQIGTLATLYPGRVTMGLGRAPGTDPRTAAALRRRDATPSSFACEVLETLAYLGEVSDDVEQAVPGSLQLNDASTPLRGGEVGLPGVRTDGQVSRPRAIPGEGTRPDTWVLGSSINGARVAGTLGLPFAFASHFSPAQADAAFSTYRSVFAQAQADGAAVPSSAAEPRLAAGVNVVVAPTHEEATYLASSAMMAAARIVAGCPAPLDPPTHDAQAWRAIAGERAAMVEASMALTLVGTAQEVAAQLEEVAHCWGVDELLIVSTIYDPQARQRSYRLLAEQWMG